jgi:hypothetical protein
MSVVAIVLIAAFVGGFVGVMVASRRERRTAEKVLRSEHMAGFRYLVEHERRGGLTDADEIRLAFDPYLRGERDSRLRRWGVEVDDLDSAIDNPSPGGPI